MRGTRFLINGEPFYFKGFGKHEDSAFHGRGLDFCLNIRDLSLLDWIHANSFRTSHYPYAEEMYELCDKEGIVIDHCFEQSPIAHCNQQKTPPRRGTADYAVYGTAAPQRGGIFHLNGFGRRCGLRAIVSLILMPP